VPDGYQEWKEGRQRLQLAAIYSRPAGDPVTASFALKADIGAVTHLVEPSAVVSELLAWGTAYRRLLGFYVQPQVASRHFPGDHFLPAEGGDHLPLFNDFRDERSFLIPRNVELNDPRPILMHDDGTLSGIDRRRVYHAVEFDVTPETDDQIILKSALSALSADLISQLREWYKTLTVPIQSNGTYQQVYEVKEQFKQSMGI
jgi:hypothetical protein